MHRFEAGTPAIAEAIGLGAACDYLAGLGMDHVAAYERQLGTYLYEQVRLPALGWRSGRAHGSHVLCSALRSHHIKNQAAPQDATLMHNSHFRRLCCLPRYLNSAATHPAVQLSAVDGVDIYGPPPAAGRAALSSFNVKGLHASDVSTVLDQAGAQATPMLECIHKRLQRCLPS